MIANTADDTEVHGLLVCPDPDLITYWLAGEIDEQRGWGIRDDTFIVHERLAAARRARLVRPLRPRPRHLPVPHPLPRRGRHADRGPGADRARARRPRSGAADVRAAGARPGSVTPAGWRGLQEFLILDHGDGTDRGGRARGDRRGARPTPEVLEALADGRAVIVRPLEPGDLDRPDPRGAGDARGDRATRRPVVAVSPFVGGHAVKGPTDAFVAALGRPLSAAGVASLYAGLLDGIVVDEGDPGPTRRIPVLRCPTLMTGRGGPARARRGGCSSSPARSERIIAR